jgi:signal peptide peptidase SppA
MKTTLLVAMSRTAWAMTDRMMKIGIAVLSRDQWFGELRREALEATEGQPLKNTKCATVRDGVAVVPVVGPIFRRADAFEEMCGGESATYEALRKDFQKAIDDPMVRAIVLDIDSPGGEVNGCDELAQAVYDARGKKPIVAYVGGMGASAAYWIASAADEIVAAPTAELGSIGVRSGYIDDSKALEKAGFKEWVFVASQSPKKSFDPNVEGDRERLQVVLDDLADVFIARVARNRGVTAEKVMKFYGQGDVMVGERAVAAGLADRLGSFESLLAEVSGRRLANNVAKGATAMATDYTDEECDDCMEGMKEENAALGLDTKAPRAARLQRVQSLAELERQVLEATGADAHPKALGIIKGGMEASAALAKIQRDAETQKRAQLQLDFKAALADERLSLGHLTRMVPTFLSNAPGSDGTPSDRQKATAAIAAIEGPQTREALVTAIAQVTASADTVEQLRAFTEVLPQLPAAHVAPPLDNQNRATVMTASTTDLAKFGIKAETLARFGNVHSVADIHNQKQGA